jgi:homoserine kinase type II
LNQPPRSQNADIAFCCSKSGHKLHEFIVVIPFTRIVLMAVFTPVDIADLSGWIEQFPLGQVSSVRGISSGIENSNFFLTTATGEYVLTIFENLHFSQLPFYLQLMRHLAERGILVPKPIANHAGAILHSLHGKPASIVSKLPGKCEMAPRAVHCTAVGSMLARMHLQAKDFDLAQPNLRGLTWWRETLPVVLPYLDQQRAQLLSHEVEFQTQSMQSATWQALPHGPIHADLFRNNVMFDGEKLGGFFDFYFAGSDYWLFDVAVTVNDWCIDTETGVLDSSRVDAMLAAYSGVRPFTAVEQLAWVPMLRAAALRFWMSRLYDYHVPRDAEMLTPHDPTHFEKILRLRIADGAPTLPLR